DYYCMIWHNTAYILF
nr:immunoglobulin light chain junction region [Macaca mulatta]MOV97003.1 immunoglobulin light chain junction region [Macaca mulatta]MOV97222.1 immunoglobulin light chain junction region [Macaca mulatta]MOV97654.1 immunoglobulin light chain junction region [Macaca mulatta]MOV98922.1 immunoglobulin light chain junction region [Macaca mulatta]